MEHKELGKIYFVQSKCGLACDHPGSYYDGQGNRIYTNLPPQLPVHRLPKGKLEEFREWEDNLI